MKKYLLFVLVLMLGACVNPELSKAKEELSQLKADYEELAQYYNELQETRLLSEKVVDLNKTINIELDVLDKQRISFLKDGEEVDILIILGNGDFDHNTPLTLTADQTLYDKIEIGKAYRFSVRAIFVYESEDEYFRYELIAQSAQEITSAEK